MFRDMPPPQHCEEFLARFRMQKGKKTESRQELTIGFTPSNGAPFRTTLTQANIEAAWRKALNRPLETARREVARLASMVEGGCVTSPLVVVSGGTCRNPAVKSSMKSLCKEAGVPVVFTEDFKLGITYE